MNLQRRIVLASGNAGKLGEFSALLAPLGLDLVAQSALGVAPADEPFATFLENALTKARHASRLTGLPALADDSGICVDALGGRPGVRSARWAALGGSMPSGDAPSGDAPFGAAPSDVANNARLVADLSRCTDRSARYYCVLVLVRSADDPRPVFAEASWRGELIDEPRGAHGFGYDPHFLIPSLGLTVAELDDDTKNRLSHRGRAMRALIEQLRGERIFAVPASEAR